MRNALKKVGIEKKFRFHDPRRTFAANFMISNGSITSLNKILGHSTPQMTMRYIYFSPENKEGEIDKLSNK